MRDALQDSPLAAPQDAAVAAADKAMDAASAADGGLVRWTGCDAISALAARPMQAVQQVTVHGPQPGQPIKRRAQDRRSAVQLSPSRGPQRADLVVQPPGASKPHASPLNPPIAHGAAPEICAPAEIAARICRWSLAKTHLPLRRLILLGLLAGVYIGFGAALSLLVSSDGVLGFGTMRWIAGITFSLGLVLVVIGGAELSTGNCLMVLAWRSGMITARQMWHNWLISFAMNGLGAAALAWLIVASGALDTAVVRRAVIGSAEAKMALPFDQAFLKGVLANMLVCLAVWLTFSTQTVIGKLVGIVFPISAFVALGFEHSIANCFTLPAGLMLGAQGSGASLLANLVPVTLGNLVGGAACIALMLGQAHTAGTARAP